jgi:SSS family solute:Na+ symporter
MHFLDWGVLFLYLAALIGIGLYHSRRGRRTPDDFILAGRRLSLPGFVATLVATWYGGILGVGENTFRYGLQTWFIFGLPYYVFALGFAFWLAPRIRSARRMTIPDHFYQHYGPGAGLISALYLLFLASPAPYILSIGTLVQFTLGIPFGWALILSTVASLIYIWYGGFGAVVRTDLLQFVLMFGGFLLLIGFAWAKVGSPLAIIDRLPESHRSITGGHSVQYLMVWFFIALWTFVDPGFYQRCAAARSPQVARRGIVIAVGFWFLFDTLTLVSGFYARVLVPASEPLFAYPNLGQQVLPPLFFGLFLVGVLATIMSTIDSLGLISAVTFGRDILWRIRKHSRQPAEQNATLLTQKGLAVTAFLAVLLALSLPSVVGLWYLIGSLFIPGLLLPFLLTFTPAERSDRQGVLLLTLPLLVTCAWFAWGQIQGEYPLQLEPFYPGVLTSLVTLLGLNLSRPSRRMESPEKKNVA